MKPIRLFALAALCAAVAFPAAAATTAHKKSAHGKQHAAKHGHVKKSHDKVHAKGA